MRNQSKPHNFEDQIATEKTRTGEEAPKLPHGPQKDAPLKKIRQLETASHLSDWLTSPGLRPARVASHSIRNRTDRRPLGSIAAPVLGCYR
jgi:hypothetical protein